eukprot:CAMPEP_0184304252 /NCGR_PEP_ID=MMETSP1049-20130417/13803_1 /TAXON_ID=77928 /ORGANISM="Proteomonas sulcata, Strain CCMP704" /LENGTH=180 /DNA_ID=CAMNT_0026616017 /DNA_START=27 /DNA_END=569 /DNA_ORIENTATION=+
MNRGAEFKAKVAMGLTLVALSALALTTLTTDMNRRVVLQDVDGLEIPETDYTGFNPDSPNKADVWAWKTQMTPDGEAWGHGPDWIYQDGWQNPGPGTLKGPASYYYNVLKDDEDAAPAADIDPSDIEFTENNVANEQSFPDHSTSEPYAYASSYGSLTGPNAVDNILNFDDYLMDSNGIY